MNFLKFKSFKILDIIDTLKLKKNTNWTTLFTSTEHILTKSNGRSNVFITGIYVCSIDTFESFLSCILKEVMGIFSTLKVIKTEPCWTPAVIYRSKIWIKPVVLKKQKYI